ncbi:MAG: GNAT family N-acetyltransferase [Bacteroidota bacterium]
MELTTLEQFSIESLTNCFNEAFSDYFIKFVATPQQLADRWHRGRVDFSLSGGAVANGNLQGIIMSGVDAWNGQLTTYNAATGVIPSARGKKLTRQIYDYLIPKFEAKGIKQCTLEVIQRNDVAIHVYEKIGFRKERAILCFSGAVNTTNLKTANNCLIKKIENPDWELLRSFWDFKPSWENNHSAVKKAGPAMEVWGIFDGELKGYAVKSLNSGYIAQFGVKKEAREQGYGASLFKRLGEKNETLVINNVDSRSENTLNFLHRIGMKNKINQYEMKMEL